MAKRKSKSLSFSWTIILALVVFGAAASATYYLSSGIGKGVKKPESKPVVENHTTITEVPERKVVIYLPVSEKNRFYLVPATRTTELKGDILSVAIKVLLATNGESGEAGKLIPKGTRLLVPVKVSKEVAALDLSKEFVDNFSGGSTQEALVLNSIAHTLVENSGGKVRKVQILVEGNPVESLGGHFELTDPIEADSTLLKPDK
ncbi:GerMN domain-containing protein [bacterium]|nr:GerMN domain-containing protein [bacterium]